MSPLPTSEHATQARATWEKTPNDLALSTALAQALLNDNKPADAYDIAKRTYALHPHALTAMEKLALSAIATQRWPAGLRKAQISLQTAVDRSKPADTLRLADFGLRIAPIIQD